MKIRTLILLFFGISLIFSGTALAITPEKDGETTPEEIFLAAENSAELIFQDSPVRKGFSDTTFVLIKESINKGYRDKDNLLNLLNRMDAFVIEGKTPYAEWLRKESPWYAKESISLRFRISNLPD